jgi:hypothetical protein
MTKVSKHKSERYITGSYSIPTFVAKPEKFDLTYDVAILRRGKDKKLHYFTIDEDTEQEVEITPDQAWGDFRERLLANAMSHDIIPACLRILEKDGWDCSFDDLYTDAHFIIDEYEEDFSNHKGTALQAIKLLPQHHDNWATRLIRRWQNFQPFVNYGLCQFNYSEFYLYLHSSYGEDRFFCSHDSEELLGLIESSFTYLVNHINSGKEDWDEERNSLKRAIYDLITIAPSRSNNQEEIDKLKELKRLNDQLLSGILEDVLDEVKGHPGLQGQTSYLSDIEKFASQIE